MAVEIYKGILEVREINRATKGYAITLDTPRDNPKFKSEGFAWKQPVKPLLLEFDLKKIPPTWSKLGIIIKIIEYKDDEKEFV